MGNKSLNNPPPRSSWKHEIPGIISLTAALFLLLCLFSYSPQDPSITHVVPEGEPVHNLIGPFGARLSYALIWLFGLGILLLPAGLLLASVLYFIRPDFTVRKEVLFSFSALILASCGLLSLLSPELSLHGVVHQSGGLLGKALMGLLTSTLGFAGTLLSLTVALILSLMALFRFSLRSLGSGLKTGLTTGGQTLMRLSRKGRSLIPAKKEQAPRIGSQKSAAPPEKRKDRPPEPSPLVPVVRRGGGYTLPPLSLLDYKERKDTKIKKDALLANSRTVEKTLADFGVEGKVVEVQPGPVVTLYELEPAPGVKINRITTLSDDLALALKAPSIRIMAPIPGKAAVGIEIPNGNRETVYLREVLDSETFRESRLVLPIALGKDIVGIPVVADLTRMPHLLIAGTTGSGKSVSLNAMICSILLKAAPEDVKFLMIDPKRLELSSYEGIPHLLHPVVVNPKKAAQVLKWAVEEMERRYQLIAAAGVKNIDSYNKALATAAPQQSLPGLIPSEGNSQGLPPAKLPYIVIIIDELADLMMVAQKNVEDSLTRLAQMARAAGIHLMLATQRPSVDVITGLIKANFPTRISFQVSSKVDSRTILDQQGAESLLGSGDMLFVPPGTGKMSRIHGAYVSDREIEQITEFIKQQAQPTYDESISRYEADSEAREGEKGDEDFDEKYDEAVELVTDLGQASISLVQRYMKIGYNRAARLIERMEAEGIVGPSDGAKPRKVLVGKLPR
ncbi:DNA translocase FtsK [Syntrophus gentianae]|uniref:DNA translocase FtsK n=1 Tax=Syntrophus gentianae TaxID=43775 RepID=A0A1H7UVN0_9BACT|nr:DNA translocase FtsK [Syntrophus gentianae]SEM00517.1 DNA translocase FtsK [Syntrophus gentianae]